MKKLIIIVFLLGSLTLFAQEQVIKEYPLEITKQNPLVTKKNSIGIRYSGISGYGLSMQRRFADNYTLKFTGLIHYSEYTKGYKDSTNYEDSKEILYDYGFELQRDVFKTDGMRVSVLGGIYFSREENKNKQEDYYIYDENLTEDKIVGGIGVSLEFYVKKALSVNFDFGYVFDNTEGKEGNEEIPFTENKTQLGLGVGLSYLF
ncbi:MAG: hypothetical protein PF574_06240 [Candidatus Delongbacteria bacterium]|nr:hypothetical protein [Candidatus Delongbacteria bacterium]